MGDINQFFFVQKNAEMVQSPILEIGSKDYGSTQNFRSLFPESEYVGVDMEEGRGVDFCLDFTDDFDVIDKVLGGGRFKTIICMSVFEHSSNPFKMADNFSKILDKNSIIILSVPFCWRIHGYPSDYWRFTPDGIKTLFPSVIFDEDISCLSTDRKGDFAPLDSFPRFDMSIRKARRYGLARNILFYTFRRLKIFPPDLDHPYLYPPTMINMIGRKGSH